MNSIAWSPDGRKIVASSYGYPSYTISVWDISTLQVLLILQVPESPIRSVAWSPDGKFIIAGSDKSDIIIWDAENGQVIHTFQINLPVEEVGFIPGRPGWIYGRCKLHLHLFSIYPGALISEGRGRLSFAYLSPRAITDFGLEESFEYAGITVENLIEEGDERWMFAVADYFLHRAEELEGNLQLSKEYYEKAGQLYSALEKNAYFYLPETYRKRRGIVQKALESH